MQQKQEHKVEREEEEEGEKQVGVMMRSSSSSSSKGKLESGAGGDDDEGTMQLVEEEEEEEEEEEGSKFDDDDDDDDDDDKNKKNIEKVLDDVQVPVMKRIRHPHTVRYIEKKMTNKGIHRMDRHPADGLSLAHPPPKSGHGGKFTWEGPAPVAAAAMDNIIDDDNDDDDEDNIVIIDEDEEAATAQGPVIGEVEVAKVAEARGVSSIEVQPPIFHSTILSTGHDQLHQ